MENKVFLIKIRVRDKLIKGIRFVEKIRDETYVGRQRKCFLVNSRIIVTYEECEGKLGQEGRLNTRRSTTRFYKI